MKTSIRFTHILFIVGYVLLGVLLSTNTALAQKEAEKIKTYLQTHAARHHLSGNDLKEMIISSQYLSPTTGWYHIYYNQVYQSVEVYNGILNATLVKDKVEHVGNNFIENIATRVPSGITGFQQSPLNAIGKAAAHLGLSYNPINSKEQSVIKLANGQVSKAVYSNSTISDEAIPVKLYWYAHTDTIRSTTNIHLVWNVGIHSKDQKNYWVSQVDAYSGEILAVDDQVIKCNFGTPEHTHQPNRLPNTSSDNRATTHTQAAPLAPNSYYVFDYPTESPIHGSQTIVTNPYTKFAASGTGPGATNGWHDDDTTTYTTTRGNNVFAKEDLANDNEHSIGASPTSATLDFNYPYTHGLNTAEVNRNAAITNLFYWNNLIHDVLWKYGFDEPSGNFQKDNMGRGGLGNDYVFADAQDGNGMANANFSTPVDGLNGRMQMYLWYDASGYQPDSDFDNGIIAHEYGHGWSKRLTGGPANSSCLNTLEQAGEGWSDYLSLMLTTNWSTLTPSVASANIARGMGTYAIGEPTDGEGTRSYPYSYDFANVNSRYTYARIETWSYPHAVGTVWAAMLWDMTWEIIFQDNQIVNDIYNTTNMAGNVAALKLVNEGLRLQKCNPGFVDARNAILKADSLLFNSRYNCAIWKAFARRGLGVNASTGESTNDRIVFPDFTPKTNNGWILSSPAEVVACSHNAFSYTANFTGAGTPNISWTREPVEGISNASNNSNSDTISETLINTTNNPVTVTYKLYPSPTSCQAPIDLDVVVNPAPLKSVTDYEVCKGTTVPFGQGMVAIDKPYTNIVSGTLTINSPEYNRGVGNNTTVFIPGPENGMHYNTHVFVPTTSGSVSIETIAGTLTGYSTPYDTYLTLYHTSFNPTDQSNNFLIGDDDSGTLLNASKLTYNLVAGTTYILVVTTYDTGMTGTYQLQATANIFGGPNNWYASNSDNTPLATGSIFNPVGVAGSGIPDTSTPLTRTFYIGSSVLGCRSTATFTINPVTVGGSIAGSATACSTTNAGELILSGYTGSILRWESSNNNFSTVTQIADTTTSLVYNNLSQTTQYRAIIKNRTCSALNSANAAITINAITLPAATNYTLCQYGVIPNGLGLVSPEITYTNTASGTFTAGSSAYSRAIGNNTTIYASYYMSHLAYYRAYIFVAATTGPVSIETIGGTLNGGEPYNTHLALYQTVFNPAFPSVNFLRGDDDSGTLPKASKLTHNLTAGTTYIVVVSVGINGLIGDYELQATANIFSSTATTNWYNYSSGGTSLATGNIFNPIGVTGSGIENTGKAITKTFFVESAEYPACRIPAVITINATNPVTTAAGNIAGSTTVCSNTNSGSLTLSGHSGSVQWWESSTDNFASIIIIPITTATLNYTNLSQTTQYRALLKSGLCDMVYSHKAVVMRANSPALAADYSICKDATVPIGQGLTYTNPGYTNSVSGTIVYDAPAYWRGTGENARVYIPAGVFASSVYYQTHTFTPTTSGLVSIEVVAAALVGGSPYDTYMALYHTSFNPGSPATNFVIDNDDGGALQFSSKIKDTLTAGTTYVLVLGTYSGYMVGTYTIQATANIFGNPVNWYVNPSGGAILGTGNIFNPVGVAGAGIPNTATLLSKTFYAGYPAFGSCLSQATFTVNTINTPVLTGSTRCSPGTSILTATGCTGGTVNWYAGISGGTAIATGTSFTTPSVSSTTTYYASCTLGACVSERTPAVATIGNTTATYTTSQTVGNYHVSQTISSSANVATGVNYFAGKAIILTPGFQAGSNEVFSASIKDCL